MNQQHKRFVVACGAIALSACCALVWRPVEVFIRSARGAQSFAREFEASRSLHTDMHPDDRAIFSFMGTTGLERLKGLMTDASLSPRGRSLASNIYHRIASGKHLSVLEAYATDARGLDSSYRARCAYIYKKDTAYLKRNKPQQLAAGDSAGGTPEP